MTDTQAEMSDVFSRYRELEDELHALRSSNSGLESPEEDEIVKQMDTLWYEMSDDEKIILTSENDHVSILFADPEEEGGPPESLIDMDPRLDAKGRVRRRIKHPCGRLYSLPEITEDYIEKSLRNVMIASDIHFAKDEDLFSEDEDIFPDE